MSITPRCSRLLLIVASLLYSSAALWAQTEGGPTTATDVTGAEVLKVLESIGNSIDKQARVVDIGAGTNVAVGVLERGATSSDGPELRGIVHKQVTEIYYILDGSGTLVTGGLDHPRPRLAR